MNDETKHILVWGRGDMRTGFWGGKLPRCRRKDNIKMNLQEVGWGNELV